MLEPSAKSALFLAAFRGRQDVHARRWERAGRSGYAPVPGPLDAAAAERHLRGQEPWGSTPPRRPHHLVSGHRLRRPPGHGGRAGDVAGLPGAHLAAHLERSRSGQGVHMWLFFEAPTEAARARRLGRHLAYDCWDVEMPVLRVMGLRRQAVYRRALGQERLRRPRPRRRATVDEAPPRPPRRRREPEGQLLLDL